MANIYQKVSPFAPAGNGVTVSLAVSNVSTAPLQFDNIMPQNGGFRKSGTVRVLNSGPGLVFVELVGDGQTANAANGFPIMAGSEKTLVTGGATRIAAVTAGATTSTIYVTPGEGGI